MPNLTLAQHSLSSFTPMYGYDSRLSMTENRDETFYKQSTNEHISSKVIKFVGV